jgi:hypothetical protein
MRKTTIFLLFGIILTMNAMAQNDPTCINSTGGSATYETITYDWSVGEMAAVETVEATGLIITQGYLQPVSLKGTAAEKFAGQKKITLYPEHGKQTFSLETSFEKPGKLNYLLVDLNGRTLLKKETTVSGLKSKQDVDLSNYPNGLYLLQVSFTSHDESVIQSFKIQK